MTKSAVSRNIIIEYLKSVVIAVILAFFLKSFFFETIVVEGKSMQPTLSTEDRVFISKLEYNLNLKSFERGDIIVFEAPDKDASYIKRVIGLPGDIVKVEDGSVFVNGERLEENYINEHSYTISDNKDKEILVGDEEIFVIGDNRDPGASKDSRRFGSIKQESIRGKAVIRFFPFNQVNEL